MVKQCKKKSKSLLLWDGGSSILNPHMTYISLFLTFWSFSKTYFETSPCQKLQ